MITGSTPPGSACRIRNATMLFRSQASPQSADPSANPSIDPTYIRVSPNRWPSQPLSGTITPSASV